MSLPACPVRAGESRCPRVHLRGQIQPQKCAGVFRRNRFAHHPSCPAEHGHDPRADRDAPPSRRSCWCRARRRPCSPLRSDPADGRAFGHGRRLRAALFGNDAMVERSDEAHYAHNVVDDDLTRAYVDVIPSVPHGTSPDRPYWRPERVFRRRPSGTVRSAHAHDIATRCRTVESGDLHTVGCDPHDLLRRCVSGPHAATRPRSTGRVIAPRFSERSKTVA